MGAQVRGAFFPSATLVLALVGCVGAPPEDPFPLSLPPGFPAPQVPEANPLTAARIELGRHLFYDERISGNGTQSCASCHRQERAFADGLIQPAGSTGVLHPRNSPSLTNAAYNASLTWANPLLTELEQQILVPLFGEEPIELGVTGHEEEVLARLAAEPRYPALFEDAFPGEPAPIHWDNVVRALASFTRSLISGNSRFDRFVYQNEDEALSPSERRGLELFFSERLECHHCHGGFNFTESSVHAGSTFGAESFHNTGLYNLDGRGSYPPNNTGVYEITGAPSDMGRFRAPTLRNVAVTAPYMHDGSVATLEEVIRIYERGGRLLDDGPYAGDGAENPLKSGFIPGFTLTNEERADLLAFLESLTDESFLTDPRHADPWGTP